jgi:hypothetical protein
VNEREKGVALWRPRICPFFLRFRVSRAGIFSDLSTGEFCPLRIPVLRKKSPEDLAAASPIDKSRKCEALPPVTNKKGHILNVVVFEYEPEIVSSHCPCFEHENNPVFDLTVVRGRRRGTGIFLQTRKFFFAGKACISGAWACRRYCKTFILKSSGTRELRRSPAALLSSSFRRQGEAFSCSQRDCCDPSPRPFKAICDNGGEGGAGRNLGQER